MICTLNIDYIVTLPAHLEKNAISVTQHITYACLNKLRTGHLVSTCTYRVLSMPSVYTWNPIEHACTHMIVSLASVHQDTTDLSLSTYHLSCMSGVYSIVKATTVLPRFSIIIRSRKNFHMLISSTAKLILCITNNVNNIHPLLNTR